MSHSKNGYEVGTWGPGSPGLSVPILNQRLLAAFLTVFLTPLGMLCVAILWLRPTQAHLVTLCSGYSHFTGACEFSLALALGVHVIMGFAPW